MILTRDRSFVDRHPEVSFHVETEHVDTQLAEIIERFDLQRKIDPFSRCSTCNAPLLLRKRSDVKGKVPFFVYQHSDRFAYCQTCKKYYWDGTHHRIMAEKIARLTKRGRE